jgi:O-antigen/teichoic acid export membrane protein
MSTATTVLAEPIKKRAGLVRALGGAPWAVADQMTISAANFITMVLLARSLSQSDFGGFTLVYSVLLFANSLQFGLVTQPHNILGATLRGVDYVRYTTSTAVSQVVLAALIATGGLGVAIMALLVGWEAAPLLFAMVPAMVAWQLQEFVRRVLYTEGRLAAALANDVGCYGGLVLALCVLGRAGTLTGAPALYAHAVAFVLAAAVGGCQIRSSFSGEFDAAVVRENWHFGKWLAAGDVVGQWLSTQLFVYLAAAMLGAAAAGVLKVVHTIFGPTRVLAYAFNTLLPIRFSRTLKAGGRRALDGQLNLAFLFSIPILGGYCVLAALLAGPLLRWLYGDKYAGHDAVLVLYAVATFLGYVVIIISAALRAQRRSRVVFTSRLYATLLTTPIGLLLIKTHGVRGAALAMILTAVVLLCLSWHAYRHPPADDTIPPREETE